MEPLKIHDLTRKGTRGKANQFAGLFCCTRIPCPIAQAPPLSSFCPCPQQDASSANLLSAAHLGLGSVLCPVPSHLPYL